MRHNGVLLCDLSDKEFEKFLDENGFEIVTAEGEWTSESRESIVKSMVQLATKIFEASQNAQEQ